MGHQNYLLGLAITTARFLKSGLIHYFPVCFPVSSRLIPFLQTSASRSENAWIASKRDLLEPKQANMIPFTRTRKRRVALSLLVAAYSGNAFIIPSPSTATIGTCHATFPSNRTARRRSSGLTMIRNVDLPECVIFYGADTMLCSIDGSSFTCGSAATDGAGQVRPGVTRLLKECSEVGTPALLLTEHMRTDELRDVVMAIKDSVLNTYVQDGTLVIKSALEELTYGPDHPYYNDNDQSYLYGLHNYAPSPGFLLDAIETTAMIPKGFGGSSGFGVKQEGVDCRPPLPKHCVALVSGPNIRPTEKDDADVDVEGVAASVDGAVIQSSTVSRARCTAAKLAGLRVLYLEPEGLGTSDAEDLADAIVTGLGADDDWEVVTLDDIATPGSYWLNPPVGKDEAGNRVNLVALCDAFRQVRSGRGESAAESPTSLSTLDDKSDDSMSQDEMAKILADLDGL